MQKKSRTKNSISKWFISSTKIGTGICLLGTGLYVLYEYMNIDIYDKESKDKNEDEDKTPIHGLEIHTALKIINKLKRTEMLAKGDMLDIEKKRRTLFDSYYKYEIICEEMIELIYKIHCKVLAEFGYSRHDIKRCLKSLSSVEIWKRITIDKPEFDNSLFDNNAVKKGFVFYGEKFIYEMSKFNHSNNDTGSTPYQEDYILYDLEILKFRIEDVLYKVHKMTVNQLRYLLKEYNLYEDEDVVNIENKMSVYEHIFINY